MSNKKEVRVVFTAGQILDIITLVIKEDRSDNAKQEIIDKLMEGRREPCQ